jgi:GNAT superfamily N-acetyltransferase
VKIRPATEADIPAMQRVRIAVHENRLSDPSRVAPADYAAALGPLGRGWVTEIGSTVVGFAIGYRTGNIWALFVRPEHEGRGYGKALHDVMVSWLSQQGLRQLWLTTESGTRAEAFYRRVGWRPCGVVSNGEIRLELDLPAQDKQGPGQGLPLRR